MDWVKHALLKKDNTIKKMKVCVLIWVNSLKNGTYSNIMF